MLQFLTKLLRLEAELILLLHYRRLDCCSLVTEQISYSSMSPRRPHMLTFCLHVDFFLKVNEKIQFDEEANSGCLYKHKII